MMDDDDEFDESKLVRGSAFSIFVVVSIRSDGDEHMHNRNLSDCLHDETPQVILVLSSLRR